MAGRGKGEAPDAAGGLTGHTPVLLPNVLEALNTQDGEIYCDCTFGAGGYSRAILESADCRLLAIDRDPNAAKLAEELGKAFPDKLIFASAPFGELAGLAARNGFIPVDGVVFDLGVSSMQLDEAERGFSFMRDGPLDMRMSGAGASAADVVNRCEADELADILFLLGEERRSRAIAKAIIKRREEQPFSRTLELAELIASVLGRRHDDAKHPATRSFQALRLFVNDELGELVSGLAAAERILKPGGRLVVVTFHSLEDRIVKNFLAERSGGRGRASRHLPEIAESKAPSFLLPRRKPVEPGDAEVRANPRARSAKLRSGVRTDAAAWPVDATILGLPLLKTGIVQRRTYTPLTKN